MELEGAMDFLHPQPDEPNCFDSTLQLKSQEV